jgi:hypothetical protein
MKKAGKVVIAVVPKKGDYPWSDGDSMLLLGEIENMPGHVVVVDKQGKVWWGYHAESFRSPKHDEI